MRTESHISSATWIGIIREVAIEYRKRAGLSREALVQMFVEEHERRGAPAVTGIVFDPHSRDTFDRMKVNADRVFRWLDDETKDNNLLPTNFIPSILGAMPIDVRLRCVGRMMGGVGLAVVGLEQGGDISFDPTVCAIDLTRESSEAVVATLKIGPNSTLEQLREADKQVSDVAAAAERAQNQIRSAMAERLDGADRAQPSIRAV